MISIKIKKLGKNVKNLEKRIVKSRIEKRNEARVNVDHMMIQTRPKKNEGIDESERRIRNVKDVVEVVVVNDPILLQLVMMTPVVIQKRNVLERNPRKRGTRNKLQSTS